MSTDFSSIKEYVEWRAKWREEYAMLSDRIRWLKTQIKNDMRAKPGESHWKHQSTLIVLRNEARKMCDDREQSKISANKIWKEEHHEVTA